VAAVVVAALQPQPPQQAHEAFGPVPLEPGRSAAVRAARAGALGAPFFRSFRAVSIAKAPMAWTRSRTWNSVAPGSSSSRLLTSRRAMRSVSFLVVSRMTGARRWAAASCSGGRRGPRPGSSPAVASGRLSSLAALRFHRQQFPVHFPAAHPRAFGAGVFPFDGGPAGTPFGGPASSLAVAHV
jgi:hypothetical protein